ncbi:SDR family oxidoreductase [Paraglaciecola aquimarina]|uniref:SDR family oxidoreductase n=1 Tax=Paraglaciecola algarum TaxID=3050085 RepID=A0ABS9D0T6_9ALTE|nr:NAD(P)-binding oxidoreductase [Paraglaciecola sp. G1-23]MCF2946512.1 SDR family oxidoreductase [Paraglaciecola sp. G1-23]
MTILVLGATGATGRLLVEELLHQEQKVKIVVRSRDRFPDFLTSHNQLTITEANLLDMSDFELQSQVQGCKAVISCLGHNLTFKGMFGHPRRLVSIATKRICEAIGKTSPKVPVKYILMNTTGNQNKLAGETVSIAQTMVLGLLRHLLPPHADNEEAADYLQSKFGINQKVIEWATVRPDSLINELSVTEYHVYSSPIRSAIFDAGQTSRINVAHFMSQLSIKHDLWKKWKGQMPVVYNA